MICKVCIIHMIYYDAQRKSIILKKIVTNRCKIGKFYNKIAKRKDYYISRAILNSSNICQCGHIYKEN